MTKLVTAIGADAVSGAPGRAMGRRMAILVNASEAKAKGATSGPGQGARVTRGWRWREILACSRSSYGLSALVGVLTYVAYGALNNAWGNLALVAIALYMLLSVPLYSKLSNWTERTAARLTRFETGGRLARFCLQFLDNLLLLWVFLFGRVIDPAGLEGIGGFFATAAWITVVSQGGQYLAGWLARRQIGDADRNVVWAISISAIVTALAVSGVAWIQPMYVALSLILGSVIFGVGLVTDARLLLLRRIGDVPR